MKHLYIFLFAIVTLFSGCNDKRPLLRIGLIADPQYANAETSGKRYYRSSLSKLEQAIDTLNAHHVDFVQSLGDVIDRDWSSYDSILPIYQKLNPGIKSYHALGNHDFSIDSVHMKNLLDKLSMSGFYYAYEKNGWKFIVLDVTDYAYYSNALHHHEVNEIDSYLKESAGKSNHQTWNGAIGEKQKNWLREEIESAFSLNQKVIIFAHMPLKPKDDAHNIWNNEEIIALIEKYPNVVAYINGHNHAGGYAYENGVHYITMFGMVDTTIGSFGIMDIYQDSLIIHGYGNQQSLRLGIHN